MGWIKNGCLLLCMGVLISCPEVDCGISWNNQLKGSDANPLLLIGDFNVVLYSNEYYGWQNSMGNCSGQFSKWFTQARMVDLGFIE